MGIAEDLSAVFQEIGTQVKLLGTLPLVTEFVDGEKLDKEGFLLFTASSNTQISTGSVLEIEKNGKKYLTLFKEDQIFENNVVSSEFTCVTCRSEVTITEMVITKVAATREQVVSWNPIGIFPAYVAHAATGNKINTDNDQIYFDDKNKRIWLQGTAAVKKGHRAQIGAVNFEIGDIDETRYPGVKICEIFLDER